MEFAYYSRKAQHSLRHLVTYVILPYILPNFCFPQKKIKFQAPPRCVADYLQLIVGGDAD